MSSKLSNKKKQADRELKYIKGCRIPDMVNYLFLAAIFGLYPIIMDDKYFNITITKYHFFMYAAGVYVVLMVVAYIIESATESYYGGTALIRVSENIAWYSKPDFWMTAFLMANLFAYMVAHDKENALTGKSGRFMGLLFFIIVAMMFFVMTRRVNAGMMIFAVLAASTMYAYIVAIIQHTGVDYNGFKERISPKQYDIFISTIGNINIFASYITITVAVFFSIFVFSDKLAHRIISGIVLFLGGFVTMIANSDSAYLGLTAVAVLLFFLAYKEGYVRRYIGVLLLLVLGNLGVVIQNKYFIEDYDKRGGVAEALDRLDLAIAMLVAVAVIYIIVHVLSVVLKTKLEGLNKTKVMLLLMTLMALSAVAVIVVGIKSKAAVFTFNYKWGTYRGYIWTKCVSLFKDAPLRNKLFGYGNESLKALMNNNFYNEMMKVTGKVYDNAHNELLQYLVTTGILGAVSYIGLFVSSFVYIIKRCAGRPVAYISLAVITGYFVQGLINLNQPITTPFYFLFMAMGIGYVRYKDRVSEYDD